MIGYIIRRLLLLIPVLFTISVVIFTIIQLPPGDYLTTYITRLEASGVRVTEDQAAALSRQYGLDLPIYGQYLRWIGNILLKGDFGRSFSWNKPVSALLLERVPLTMAVSLATTAFVFAVAIPVGIYSAVRKYSFFDYFFTFLGFIGLSVPGFLLALVLMWGIYSVFDVSVGGLFSPEYADAPWSAGKVFDLLAHMWFPMIVIGLSGTAGLIRVMRGNLLDELQKQYVITARAKGVPERQVLFRYPVRIAVNPIISTIGWILPSIVGGEVLVSIVLNLQTTGPVLLQAILFQDMYLAGSITLLLSVLTVVGTLIADILLVWLDPRIRYGGLGE
ncbi:MAG: ABC transporter permease [Caldilineaceae bacterium]|nr:ABC transporter permease [Caldilineaceae bacterium]